jgi:hypothetical protein
MIKLFVIFVGNDSLPLMHPSSEFQIHNRNTISSRLQK